MKAGLYQCPICKDDVPASTRSKCIQHLLRVHGSTLPYACPHDSCDSSFLWPSEMEDHAKRVHKMQWTPDWVWGSAFANIRDLSFRKAAASTEPSRSASTSFSNSASARMPMSSCPWTWTNRTLSSLCSFIFARSLFPVTVLDSPHLRWFYSISHFSFIFTFRVNIHSLAVCYSLANCGDTHKN